MYLFRLNDEKLNPLLYEAFKPAKNLETFAKNVSQEINNDIKLIDETETLKQTKKLKPQFKKKCYLTLIKFLLIIK